MKTKITLCVENASLATASALEQFSEAIKDKDKDAKVSLSIKPFENEC